jgi:hypothetical protein
MEIDKGQSKTKWNSNLEMKDMEIKGMIQSWKLQFWKSKQRFKSRN